MTILIKHIFHDLGTATRFKEAFNSNRGGELSVIPQSEISNAFNSAGFWCFNSWHNSIESMQKFQQEHNIKDYEIVKEATIKEFKEAVIL